jgi:transcription elongation factor Elf1
MLHIDAKYVSILGPRLRNFKKKSDYLWNFSCPICGDSSTNKTKARGYIYRTKTGLFYRCHNCSHGTNLGNIIKHIDEGLYKQYVVERYREGATQYNSHKDIGKLLPVESRQLIRETNVLDLSLIHI